MKDETKRQFEEVFSQHERKLEQQRKAKVAQETKEQEFIRTFRERCASTIKPALERIAAYLSTKGMNAHIEYSEEAVGRDGRVQRREQIMLVLVLTAGQDAARYHRPDEMPHIAFWPDKHKGIVDVYQSTIGPGRGGQGGSIGSVRLDQLTGDFLEERVLSLVREVLK